MGPKLATYMELIDMLMELIDMLGWCSIIYGEDISDGYHVSVCGGCTMSLVWGWGVTGVEEVWVDVESADSGRAAASCGAAFCLGMAASCGLLAGGLPFDMRQSGQCLLAGWRVDALECCTFWAKVCWLSSQCLGYVYAAFSGT